MNEFVFLNIENLMVAAVVTECLLLAAIVPMTAKTLQGSIPLPSLAPVSQSSGSRKPRERSLWETMRAIRNLRPTPERSPTPLNKPRGSQAPEDVPASGGVRNSEQTIEGDLDREQNGDDSATQITSGGACNAQVSLAAASTPIGDFASTAQGTHVVSTEGEAWEIVQSEVADEFSKVQSREAFPAARETLTAVALEEDVQSLLNSIRKPQKPIL